MKNEEKISQKVISQWVKRISQIFCYPAVKQHEGYKNFTIKAGSDIMWDHKWGIAFEFSYSKMLTY